MGCPRRIGAETPMFDVFRKIAFKLAILAGAPLIGTLVLSTEIARENQDRGKSAAAIGSIEDLAELSLRTSTTVDELQSERATAALALGLDGSYAPEALAAQERKTDASIATMNGFLATRDLRSLPPKLGGYLAEARSGLEGLAQVRSALARREATIDEVLSYYGAICDQLTNANSALTRLSDDGELLRALSSLVATMRVKESESRQHALLAHVFAKGEFPPGLYRYLVNQVTEEQVHVDSLQSFATPDQVSAYQRTFEQPAAKQSEAMRAKALSTPDDDFGIDARAWFDLEQKRIEELKKFEQGLAREVSTVARYKVQEAQRALRYNESLVAAAVLLSILLTAAVGRSIYRSVQSLTKVTGRIQRDQDFSVRAAKTSRDELGHLTDAFNAMLQGIQDRDGELAAHRENLECQVVQRTSELSRRNEDMRLVLDTVEQGLVTIDKQGLMMAERSRAFDQFFGAPGAGVPFFEHIAGGDERLAMTLALDWEQMTEGVLPLELSLEQAKSRLQVGSAYFALRYNPLLSGEKVRGALLTVSNITSDILARRAEAEQAEQLKTFARLMDDKSGFLEFFGEARELLARIQNDEFAEASDRLRAVHTLKGNAALFDVTSVAEAAHQLEEALLQVASDGVTEALGQLVAAWASFAARFTSIVEVERAGCVEVSVAEIEQLLTVARAGGVDANTESLLMSLSSEPVSRRFARFGQQLSALSAKLGKASLEIDTAGGDIRLPVARFAPFWSVLSHVVRNVADHGLQSEDERASTGKSPHNRVSLVARTEGGQVVIEISDDGYGVDWEDVAKRAAALGLPFSSPADLRDALFASKFSTTSRVSSTSGRGIGMGAVRQVCRELGGSCELESQRHHGSKLTCRLALRATAVDSVHAPTNGSSGNDGASNFSA
jgi:two-component system, chemotaxis family, sensor kinase CheA